MRLARPFFAAPSYNRIFLEGAKELSLSHLSGVSTTAHIRRRCRSKYSIPLSIPLVTSVKLSLSSGRVGWSTARRYMIMVTLYAVKDDGGVRHVTLIYFE